MVIYRNPSVRFLKFRNPKRVIGYLEDITEKVGEFEDSKGKTVELMLTHEGLAVELNPDIGVIQKAIRGMLIRDEKRVLNTSPPTIVNDPYRFYYYGLETTRGNFVLICAKKPVSLDLFRRLRAGGFDVRNVHLGRDVQDRLCNHNDMFYYASAIDDEVEQRAGRIRVRSPSTDVPLKGVRIDRLINGRGRSRDRGITWRESSGHPKISFWISQAGVLSVKNPELDEGYLLLLINRIIEALWQ